MIPIRLQPPAAASIAAFCLTLAGCCGPCCPPSNKSTKASASAAPVDTPTAADTSTAKGPPARVNAATLVDAYLRDERKADKRYDGRRLRVDGYVIEVQPGTLDNPMVSIAGTPGADPLYDKMAMCRVTDAFVERSKKLVPGSKVVVEGTCEGYRLDRVRLEDCVILDPKP